MERKPIRDRHCIFEVIEEYYRSHDEKSTLYIKLEDPDGPNLIWRVLGYEANPDTLVFYDDIMKPWCGLMPNMSKNHAIVELASGVEKALEKGYDVRPIIDGDEYEIKDKKLIRKRDGKQLIISGPSLNPLQARGDVKCSTVRKTP